MDAAAEWPGELPVARVRVARPTDQLENVVRFYREGLGLPELGSFAGHAGYDGVFLGLPGLPYHLEFTSHEASSPCPAPSRDNLLVLYFERSDSIDRAVERLAALGHHPVPSENPYWETVEDSVTIEDPDGWRVVLVRPRHDTIAANSEAHEPF